MNSKDKAIAAISSLDDDVTLDDVIDQDRIVEESQAGVQIRLDMDHIKSEDREKVIEKLETVLALLKKDDG